MIDGGLLQAAIFEVGARDFTLRRGFKLLGEKCLGYAMHFDECGALLILFAFFGRALFGLRDGDAAFFGDDANRFWKRTLFHFHNELEDVATDAAAKAMVNLFGRVDGKRRRFFRVEWAKAGEILAALLQAHVFADDADDVRLLLNAIRE